MKLITRWGLPSLLILCSWNTLAEGNCQETVKQLPMLLTRATLSPEDAEILKPMIQEATELCQQGDEFAAQTKIEEIESITGEPL